jgi:hypothetical protein
MTDITDTNPGGWPDAAMPGYPLHPERNGEHMMEWTDEHGRVWREVWKWRTDSKPPLWLRPNFTGGPYGYEPKHLTAPIYASIRYLGPCHTPAEVAALVEAARREEREACEAAVSPRAKLARNMQERARGKDEAAYWQNRASALELGASAIRARGDAIPGEYQSEAEQERVELINRLGRVTEELRLPMGATASRIIEAIRERVDDAREACASLSVRVEVPPGAETWTPLEAWQEALVMLDASFRAAIRARGDA